MSPSPSAAIVVPEPAQRDWLVWFDLACDDVLALPPSEMTPALAGQLAQAGIEIHRVQASTRKQAVARAFPPNHPLHAMVSRLDGGARRPGRRPH